MIMVHGLFQVPHVDSVYWTLQVELYFYCGMFLLYLLKRLHNIHILLFGLLLLRVIYYVLEHRFGINLPWILFHLMILQYIPWFALGISVYLLAHRKRAGIWLPAARTAAFAVTTLVICESVAVALLAFVFAGMVSWAAAGRLTLLRWGPFVWLGSISYPLYLIHENIGWAVILQLLSRNVPVDMAIIATLGAVLLLAEAHTRWIEQPAMHWIRHKYKNKTLKTLVIDQSDSRQQS
jgi:peptidoglycan/LPS O-acetylase OafA/YrhL